MIETSKSVLGLEMPTDPRWVNLAEKDIGFILSDHAWCEQKAATTCISLIVHYPDYPVIPEKLSPIVTEEWGHFRMVLRELKRRKLPLQAQRKDEYVNALISGSRKGVNRPTHLMDKLLMSAMIEARSCERFRLLSKHISGSELKSFYHDLMVAEAGHYRLFIDLAGEIKSQEEAREEWEKLRIREAEILENIEVRGDRMH